MKRIILILCLLILSTTVVSAASHNYVTKVNDSDITVDGNLSEWTNATVLTWRSPQSSTEINLFYFLHSNSYYFIGAKIYDYDNVDDDTLTLYLNDSSSIYRFNLTENSNALSAFRYVSGSWNPISVNYSVTYTPSSTSNPYSYVELRIPKSTLNNSSTLKFFAEYTSSHLSPVYGWYPPAATFGNSSSWDVLTFIESADRLLNLTILDRDNVSVNYTGSDLLIEARYAVNDTHIVTIAGHTNVTSIPLPASNVTVLIKYLNTSIFEKSYNLSLTNVSDTITINNLMKVDTPLGFLVVSVEKNGSLKSVDFDYTKGRAIVMSQSKEVLFDSSKPWFFLGVLYADGYDYNPATGHLIARLNDSKDVGLVLILDGAGHPVLSNASNTVESIFYDYNNKVYHLYVNPGTFRFSSSSKPFAITFNDSALRTGNDYSTDALNVTTVTVSKEGCLNVYYSNPTSTSLVKAEGSLKIFISSPYSFNGKIHYVVKKNGQILEERTKLFKVSAPLTSVSIKPSASGDVEIAVYDVDSGQKLYSTTVKQLYFNYALVIAALLIVLSVVAFTLAIMRRGKEEARARAEKEWRFFKRL